MRPAARRGTASWAASRPPVLPKKVYCNMCPTSRPRYLLPDAYRFTHWGVVLNLPIVVVGLAASRTLVIISLVFPFVVQMRRVWLVVSNLPHVGAGEGPLKMLRHS